MAGASQSAKALATGAMRMSKRILLSYILDWILILGIAGIGGGFNKGVQNTNKRPFSLQDPSISYPYREDTVSVPVLAVVALLIPAAITMVISLIFIPGPTASKATPKSLIWRRKIWEWNTAWMGLGLALALTFMITEGLKDLAGKPRPYAIGVCNPDLSAIDRYRVGGLGQNFDLSGATPILVSSDICQERDPGTLREIFASWPSGHSSFSWAGLLYLSLFLCAKFAVGIPYFLPNQKTIHANTYEYDNSLRHPQQHHTGHPASPHGSSTSSATRHEEGSNGFTPPPRNSTAAPPIYLLILAVVVPIGTAIFICVSRWFDFHHHGIDIFSGAVIGATTAYSSFRYYHMPIRQGSGWAWGARSRGRAFWVGVGRDGYVGEEGWTAKKAAERDMHDIESGSSTAALKDVAGAGVSDRGDVEGGNGIGRQEEPVETGYTIRSQG
ncbi:hypothetical protein OHC33_000729 [Knufia fluminis]|uniref:Phosphatidic acid phosphatase type 2/haloperoxidase domain-containing protein n=1 Tax=Knufia fluminis TaxID=191047 RepID=A0AAN8EQU9_9EURO|nr:hypothetical protein OHC33_000729 [Knufia fluminis]